MSSLKKIAPKHQDWRDKFRAWGRAGAKKSNEAMTPERRKWYKEVLPKLGIAARALKRKKAALKAKSCKAST